MADGPPLSYEEFIASVFTRMGIPVDGVELVSGAQTHAALVDVIGLTPLQTASQPVQIKTEPSGNERFSKDSTPDEIPSAFGISTVTVLWMSFS